MSSARELGPAGEELAAARLCEAGWEILERNYRYRRFGEVDIIARDGETIVFLEVKSRRSLAFGSPLEAVDGRKAGRIRLVAERYLQEHPAARAGPLRFDVICITYGADGAPAVEHIRGAF